ncbi:MAG: GAF domain-containing protein [Ignavibacteria bacterium]|nr:GAF domain-containing protein [Ignavibacteria bacterium]
MAIQLTETKDLTRQETYELVITQVKHLVSDESNLVANLANVSSLLKNTFEDYLWVGFYVADPDSPEELVLGPFQGRPACTRIKFGKGVCGTSASLKQTIIVDDVDQFPGHIVCDSLSKSEIVVPIIFNGNVRAVLDVDSDRLSNFNQTDSRYLEELVNILTPLF